MTSWFRNGFSIPPRKLKVRTAAKKKAGRKNSPPSTLGRAARNRSNNNRSRTTSTCRIQSRNESIESVANRGFSTKKEESFWEDAIVIASFGTTYRTIYHLQDLFGTAIDSNTDRNTKDRKNSLNTMSDLTFEECENDANANQLPPTQDGAKRLLQAFVKALQEEDLNLICTFVHKSLRRDTNGREDLDRSVKDYQFRYACKGVANLKNPIRVTRIVPNTGTSGIGFRDRAENGRIEKFFLECTSSSKKMPVPVQVFFPSGGGAPKICHFGSIM